MKLSTEYEDNYVYKANYRRLWRPRHSLSKQKDKL